MTFEESVVIDATPAALFRLSQDYDRRLEWDPFLRSACLVGGAHEAGVEVKALYVSRGGWAMETEYVSFNPPQATAVRMTRGSWFLGSFAGSWRFEDAAPGRTRVGFRYSLRAWPGWLSWAIAPVVSWAFARDTRLRLRALKEAVESRGMLAETPGAGFPTAEPPLGASESRGKAVALVESRAKETAMLATRSVIHSDPEILAGTRVPLRTLLDYLEAGDSLNEFLEDFLSVTREQAVSALRLAELMLVAHAHPA